MLGEALTLDGGSARVRYVTAFPIVKSMTAVRSQGDDDGCRCPIRMAVAVRCHAAKIRGASTPPPPTRSTSQRNTAVDGGAESTASSSAFQRSSAAAHSHAYERVTSASS